MNGSFGRALRRLRRQAGLSQRELAQRIGFDLSSISKFENGHRVPSADTALALSEALGIAGEELLALVSKIPSQIEKAVAASPQAQGFLRAAQRMGLTDSEWKGLRCYLQHLRQERLEVAP